MAEKIYLETTELENIASSLKTKSNTISDEFTNSCYTALEMCNKCLEITGLDTTKFFDSFKTIYSNLGTRCNNFSKFILENIIPSYNEITNAITKNFNTELGDKIAGIIGITGSAATLGVTSAPEALSNVQSAQSNEEKTVNEDIKDVVKEEKKPKEVNEKTSTTGNNSNNNNNNNTNRNTNPTEQTSTPSAKVDEPINEIVNESVNEEIVQEPQSLIEPEIIEEQPVLEKSEALLASDVKNGSIKKGVGVGIGLAGAAVAAGTTGYIINSNKEKEEENKTKKELIDSKKFLESEGTII